jgi:CheY-like chemotaxis protein
VQTEFEPRDGGTGPLVFYVEDDPINVLLMQAIFDRRPGLRLVVATDGQQALQLAPGLRPDLLLLDLRLPDVHGAELLPLLRSQPGYEGLPAVAVTAEPNYKIARSGFSELWPKPLNVSATLQRLDQLLSGAPALA